MRLFLSFINTIFGPGFTQFIFNLNRNISKHLNTDYKPELIESYYFGLCYMYSNYK